MRRVSPRLHMLVLVCVTAVAGFAASYLLLQAGLTAMALRYPLAVGIAYIAFLGLVRVWLRRFRLRRRGRDAFEVDELSIEEFFTPEPASEPQLVERTSESAGAEGEEASWGDAPSSLDPTDAAASPGGGGWSGSGGGWDLDLDEGALWFIPVVLVGTIAFGVVAYMVMLAPTLLAELLLDVGLAAGLYRRLVRAERRSWLTTAVRSTIIPACFTAALLAAAGAVMQRVAPDAVSIGGVVRQMQWNATRNGP